LEQLRDLSGLSRKWLTLSRRISVKKALFKNSEKEKIKTKKRGENCQIVKKKRFGNYDFR